MLHDTGSIAAGKSADFVVLGANPLDDITNTRNIEAVYLRGEEVEPGRTERRLGRKSVGPGMKHAHTISWAIFALLGAITVVISLTSLSAAYFNPDADLIAGRFTPAEVANGDAELAAALSARRGTAAAFGALLRDPAVRDRLGAVPEARPALQVAAHRQPG